MYMLHVFTNRKRQVAIKKKSLKRFQARARRGAVTTLEREHRLEQERSRAHARMCAETISRREHRLEQDRSQGIVIKVGMWK